MRQLSQPSFPIFLVFPFEIGAGSAFGMPGGLVYYIQAIDFYMNKWIFAARAGRRAGAGTVLAIKGSGARCP
ncbi:hypothetical protein [Pseudogulbenkiania ferrooxidans]|uniref:hypothetical protein n=1 Tax=Pseudogulbenkiania ferrooxidans TaxID=549169 RepID=UPI00135F1BAA|nr:hypothetical protein [Pseudogulbenkiania ferrooxidans]